MTNISKEILEKYQIRKTKKQKTAFIKYATNKIEEMGYSVTIQDRVRNIIVGDPEKAKVIYTAHYDTCAKLPFPNFLTPQNIFVYILYNIAVVLGALLIGVLVGFTVGFILATIITLINNSFEIPDYFLRPLTSISYFILFIIIMFGPANKHTANDNTSGVNTLFEIMEVLPEELKDKVAFVFFDLEELGLIGSKHFAKKYKNIKKNTLVVNYDCVSDGKNMLIVAKKEASNYADLLRECFISDDTMNVEVVNKGLYPSDQASFKKGVGIATFNKTKNGILYMDKIHTSKDTVYREENIDFIVQSSLKLAERL